MEFFEMQETLENLNEKWDIDFVSATSGTCCWSCAIFETFQEDKLFEDAETFLVIKWYSQGMNYYKPFDETEHFFINYTLPSNLTLDKVCKDLEMALGDEYKVIKPKDTNKAIELIKL